MEKIRLECRNTSVILESCVIRKDPAIGYSIRYSDSISTEQALFEADQAMYLDKKSKCGKGKTLTAKVRSYLSCFFIIGHFSKGNLVKYKESIYLSFYC